MKLTRLPPVLKPAILIEVVALVPAITLLPALSTVEPVYVLLPNRLMPSAWAMTPLKLVPYDLSSDPLERLPVKMSAPFKEDEPCWAMRTTCVPPPRSTLAAMVFVEFPPATPITLMSPVTRSVPLPITPLLALSVVFQGALGL